MGADNDHYHFTMITECRGQVAAQTRYWRQESTLGTGPTQTQIATAIDAAIAAPLKAAIGSQATYKGSLCSRVWPLPRVIDTITTSGSGPGVLTGDPLPLNVTAVITLRTLNAGRSYRGRFYVPFPTVSVNDTAGTPVGSYLGTLDTLGTALITPLVGVGAGGNTATMTPVLWNPVYQNHVLQTPTSYKLDSRLVRDKWGQQRRRGSYGQLNISPI